MIDDLFPTMPITYSGERILTYNPTGYISLRMQILHRKECVGFTLASDFNIFSHEFRIASARQTQHLPPMFYRRIRHIPVAWARREDHSYQRQAQR